MSGRRHNDQQSGDSPLGDKIKAEVLSALKLLFKSVEHYTVSVTLPASVTAFITDIPCETVSLKLAPPQPMASDDPIRVLQSMDLTVQAVPLLESPPLAQGAPCHWEPVLCSEPVLEQIQLTAIGVPLDTVQTVQTHVWPVTSKAVRIQQKVIGKLPDPLVKQRADAQPLVTRSFSALNTLAGVSVKNTPRYYALPIRKASIPPHRFSVAVRDKFRQALAEKAGTHEGNVQLKLIFERMNMGLFSAIQADEAGSLLCTPKSELLGRNNETQAGQALLRQLSAGSEASYLVLGVRLDTKADIRALVPVESLNDLGQEGDSIA